MTEAVVRFWDQQADTYGRDPRATAPDVHYRQLEIRHILDHLPQAGLVLDIGCGNGYSTRKFAAARIHSIFIGMDASQEMIEAAKAADPSPNLRFVAGDVRILPAEPQFNTVISERCLINLASWDEQQQAILRVKDAMKPGGLFILVENFIDGLDNLNRLRSLVDLEPIMVRWHNHYFEMAATSRFLRQHFEVLHKENIGNLYYIISRVAYAAMARQEGREPSYDHVLNEVASKLPTLGDNHCYSPNWLWVLRKA